MKPPEPRPGGYHTASTPCHPLRHGAGGAGGMRREPRGGTRFAPTPPSEPKPLSSRAATTFPARLPAPGQRCPGGEQGAGHGRHRPTASSCCCSRSRLRALAAARRYGRPRPRSWSRHHRVGPRAPCTVAGRGWRRRRGKGRG